MSCERNNNTDDRSLGERCLSLSANIAQAQSGEAGQADYEPYADLVVPPLPPEEALETFDLVEGFRIEVVAHEPMITSPVAMDIDSDGRLWVVDMPSYMPGDDMDVLQDAVATMERERVPEGRVTVLEDTNGDGQMDTHRVFADSLILPRAIKVLHDGVLVGEPPNVRLLRDTDGDGKADSEEIVYSSYGDASDPNNHGFPGGLIWGMDNWLHSSNENVESIRRVSGHWQTRPFNRLGQYGMSQDNWGRLYSSSNSWPLHTHFVPHGYSDRHPRFNISEGQNVRIAPNKPLWPSHPTGVNRGYRDGMLRDDSTLVQFTSASSTTIYRGAQFGSEYVGNAFTPEPVGNLIKRMIVEGDPSEIETEARFAYEDREFLTSTDERFRPVNMYTAPDGGLYVVDMYRGVFEHASHLTDYLRNYTIEHDLHKANGPYGRIYRIVREDQDVDYDTPRFSELTANEAAGYLRHDNGSLRDQAQQVLAQCSPQEVIPELEEMVAAGQEESDWTRLQALWTLEGFDRSVYGQEELTRTALEALDDDHARLRASAIRILEPALATGDEEVLTSLESLAGDPAPYVRLQLLASLGEITGGTGLDLMARVLDENSDSPYFREMALTGVYQREAQLGERLRDEYGWSSDRGEGYAQLLAALDEAEEERPQKDLSGLTEAQRTLYENGRQKYSSCTNCHGQEGGGVSGVGSALDGSEWVQGDPEALVRIVLQGFSGAAEERGEDISGVMPGHHYLSDEDVASILTYIRQSWDNDAVPVSPEEVERIRRETEDRQDTWSPDELRQFSN